MSQLKQNQAQNSFSQKSQMRSSHNCLQSQKFTGEQNCYQQSQNSQTESHSSLLKIIKPHEQCENMSDDNQIKPPHLFNFSTNPSDQNISSTALENSAQQSAGRGAGRRIGERNPNNKILQEIENEVQKNIKRQRLQQTSQKKPAKSNKAKNKVNKIMERFCIEHPDDNFGIQLPHSRLNTARTDQINIQESNNSNDADMKDSTLERTPAFRKDVEQLDKQLLKKIKVVSEKKQSSGIVPFDFTLDSKANEPRQFKTDKKRVLQANLGQLLKLIKCGPPKNLNISVPDHEKNKTVLHQQRKQLSQAEQEKGVDGEDPNCSSDAYSHHQYTPISKQYFERSLSCCSQGALEGDGVECRSDYVIRQLNTEQIKKTIELENFDETPTHQNDTVELCMNQSVTDIQMGSGEADQKYGGQKNPIKLCRKSFFETNDKASDRNNGQMINQLDAKFDQNHIMIKEFKPYNRAVQFTEKTQINFPEPKNSLFAQNHWLRQEAQASESYQMEDESQDRYEEMYYQCHTATQQHTFSTPEQAFHFFESEQKRVGIINQNAYVIDDDNFCQQHDQIQRRRLMQLYGCSQGTVASNVNQVGLSLQQCPPRPRQNPRVNLQNLAISKFDSQMSMQDYLQRREPQDYSEQSVKYFANQFQSTTQKFQDMAIDQDQAKIDTENNHKDDKKVVITGQNQQVSAFQPNHSKAEVQRRLDFENLPNCDESDEFRQHALNGGHSKKYYMPQMPSKNVREFAQFGNMEMLKNRLQSMHQQNTTSSEKMAMRGHNLDMRMQSDLFRARDFEMMYNQGQFKQGHFGDAYEDLSNPRTPPYAKITRQRLDDQRQEYFTGAGSFVTQPSTQHGASNFNHRNPMGRPVNDQFQFQTVSPYDQKYNNSGNRQNYGVSRFIRRGATPNDPSFNFMASQYMMQGHQNSQRKTMRSAMNEQRYTNFGGHTSGSQKQKLALRPSISSDNLEAIEGEMGGHQFQMVRPFESQHKDNLNSGYDSNEFKMPILCKSQTPQRTKLSSDEEQQEMIIPKDFSSKKFAQNSYRGGKIGQPTISSFGSIIGDSQVEPLELSNNQPLSRHSDSHRNYLNQHQYFESFKSMQAHRAMIKKCPVHGGESSEFDDYKETMAMMAAQAHAYAQSCFMYFQLMAKLSKSQNERNYFLHQQAIAGCMVHGPHGDQPAQMSLDHGIPPPSLAEYPPYDPKTYCKYHDDTKDAMNSMPPPFTTGSKQDGEAANMQSEEASKQVKDGPSEEQDKKSENKTSSVENDQQKADDKEKTTSDEAQEDKSSSRHGAAPTKGATQESKPAQQASVSKPTMPGFNHPNMMPPPPSYISSSKHFSDRSRSQGQSYNDNSQSYMHPSHPSMIHDHGHHIQGPHPAFPPSSQMYPGSGPAFLPGGMVPNQPHLNRYNVAPQYPTFFMQQQMQQHFKRNKRNRKDPETMRYLMEQFKKDPTWGKETYQRVARETGLSESQVYKWGWDQKNKKNEEDDEDEEEFEVENVNDIEQSQKQEESNEQETKDEKLQRLDLAISQVKIDTDEMNHGILLPHEVKQRKSTKLQLDEDDENKKQLSLQYNTDSTAHQGGYTTDKTQGTTKLGKRQFTDVSNADLQSQTLTQTSKQQKKRDSKYAHNISNATNNRYRQENIDPAHR